ncbi:hypothetical protein [Sulfuracidifex metallicus]|uniref:Uncharacterized protein n=1 Tax=Sulfuracidifex metallicus DSM 6482 = JCM 9184 TaxID=523847 RepID=A0A6A9QQA7_SULME|nr:hypothetical protein [Sulfuracidifex metallicus]MUN29361.1 hypothetical protein [Sulfuracidifex metallicus DSM 6482 = JCM 9184]WOE50127.1 hypothetical protein RQ359_001630 [Sulfuracidifex metallicus DSM 6482 = JCM 9184]
MEKQLIEILLILALATFPILMGSWIYMYRKVINGGLEYVGEKYNEKKIVIPPGKFTVVEVNGKCVMVSEGMNSWFTIRINGGVRQRVFKIRLINTKGNLTIINESKTMSLSINIRCEASA